MYFWDFRKNFFAFLKTYVLSFEYTFSGFNLRVSVDYKITWTALDFDRVNSSTKCIFFRFIIEVKILER